MTGVEQLADVAVSRGLDAWTPERRRSRVRELLDRSNLTQSESTELDVLLLMAVGLSETSARADLLLRKKQQEQLRKRKVTFS